MHCLNIVNCVVVLINKQIPQRFMKEGMRHEQGKDIKYVVIKFEMPSFYLANLTRRICACRIPVVSKVHSFGI